MSTNIKKLKGTLGIGARNNNYRVILNSKGSGPDNETVDTLIKSISLPGVSTNDIDIHFQGKKLTIAGDTSFDGTLNITFYDTEEHSLKKSFMNWMVFIDDVKNNKRDANNASEYMTNIVVKQLSSVNDSEKAIYTYYNCYPKSVSELSYSNESTELMEFSIEFNYSHWVLD